MCPSQQSYLASTRRVGLPTTSPPSRRLGQWKVVNPKGQSPVWRLNPTGRHQLTMPKMLPNG